MAKRKPRHKRKQSPKSSGKIKLINLVLFMMVLTLTITIGAYFVILEKHNQKQSPKVNTNVVYNEAQLDEYRNERLNKYFEETYSKKPKKTLKEEPEKESFKEKIQTKVANLLKKENTFEEYTEEFEKEYIDLEKQEKQEKIKKETKQTIVTKPIKKQPTTFIDKRPKLAIVIDDVTVKSQVNKIRNIGYNITMAFLPPTSGHRNSAKIAQGLPFYMIHFPMQATNFKHEEENTLHVGDSYEKIEKRVKEIRRLYPNAIYTNNHTGSKFTADDVSMDRLILALKKYDFLFVDSRTTSKTVVKKYTKKYGMPYITRNIFLDNKQDYNYIENQLKKAIRIAKKTGSAIAIGHPHRSTLKVLKESKHLLKGLNLVYINKIPTD